MGTIYAALVITNILLFVCSVGAIFYAKSLNKQTKLLVDNGAKPLPREKRVLVPGRGIFQLQKEKIRPTYRSEEDIWAQQENEKYER